MKTFQSVVLLRISDPIHEAVENGRTPRFCEDLLIHRWPPSPNKGCLSSINSERKISGRISYEEIEKFGESTWLPDLLLLLLSCAAPVSPQLEYDLFLS